MGNTAVIAIPAPKKKRTLLPLLIILFIFSYGLMTMLIVEQGSAIQSQSNLIKILMPDSRELWALKGKAITDKQVHAQAPSNQTPSQAPSTKDPSTQVTPEHQSPSRPNKSAKPRPEVPPMPASDFLDQRRALRTI